jgi:hypothetical protein
MGLVNQEGIIMKDERRLKNVRTTADQNPRVRDTAGEGTDLCSAVMWATL